MPLVQLSLRPLARQTALAGLFVVWAAMSPALAEKRVALVIGNSDYLDVPALENPRNDADDVAAALKRLGFETTVSLDADRSAMQAAIDEFSAKVEGADVALFYYAGHAMQHQGVNYLMPVDANLTNAAGLRRMTRLNDIVSDVKRAKALRIMVIDACRDNPLTEKLDGSQVAAAGATRSAGLAKISSRTMARAGAAAPEPVSRGGDIIVYAAESGRTASDGMGRNSPFSAAFIKYVETEGQEVVSLMRRITTSVQDETKGAQRPELSISVPFEFYFKPGPPQPPPTVLQLVPTAKPHEVSAIEAQVEAIMRAIPASGRDQGRREVMVLLSDISARSGLKPDQIAQELPQSFARLMRTRKEIEEVRFLMENEPEIAPFVEIAAAAVATGRRPDMQAADQALKQAHARYGDAIKARDAANDRARANRATLSEQRGNIAWTEYRIKEAGEHYLEAARETPASDRETVLRRFELGAGAFHNLGYMFLDNGMLREAIRVYRNDVLLRLDTLLPVEPEEKRALRVRKGKVLSYIADAQKNLGGRLAGAEGVQMMEQSRATFLEALASFDETDSPRDAMDMRDGLAFRDLEFGKRVLENGGRKYFDDAVGALREIWTRLSGKPEHKDRHFIAQNNLAYSLQESSRRYDGAEGDRQIEEAIDLLQGAERMFDANSNETHRNIVRANLAQALGFRAMRKAGLEGLADFDRARELYALIDKTMERDRDPRQWAIIKRFEAEYLSMRAERTPDPEQAYRLFEQSVQMYQRVRGVVSRETSPNDWAGVSAEMGYMFVAAMPVTRSEAQRRLFARNAVNLLGLARPVLVDGGFQWDIAKVDQAIRIAAPLARPDGDPSPGGKN